MRKLALYIPAYNVAKTLSQLLHRIPQSVLEKTSEIIVVDNASTDGTEAIVRRYQQESRIRVTYFRNEINLGYAGSQKLAYDYVLANHFDVVAMLHGDAQYAPEELPQLLDPVLRGDYDLMFGSRMSGSPREGGMPLYRYCANKFLTTVENAVLGLRLSEYHSGLRVYSCTALAKIPYHRCTDGFHIFDTDIIIQFVIRGLRIGERPIRTHYDENSASLSFTGCVFYGLGILRSLAQFSLARKRILNVAKFELPES